MGIKTKAKAAVVALVAILLLPGVSLAVENPKQKALRGLKGVEIVIVEDMDPEAERLGLTRNQIKTDVELRLRKAGVRVLTKKECQETPGAPALYVIVDALTVQGLPFVAYTIRVELLEWVTLDRGLRSVGAIWNTGAVGAVGTSNIRKIREGVGDLVDRFINDYLAANPKK